MGNRLATAFVAALITGACAHGSGTTPRTCTGDRTELDGVCVTQKTADYVACVRAQGAHLGGERGSTLGAEAAYLGTRVAAVSEVKEKLERKYSVSTEAELLIIRDCGAQAGLGPSTNIAIGPTAPPTAPPTSTPKDAPTSAPTRRGGTCSESSPEVVAFVNRHPFQERSLYCWSFAKEPKGKGRLVMTFDVAPDGKVINVRESLAGDLSQQVVQCIVQGFPNVPFPPSQCGGTQLSYPMNFANNFEK